MKTLIMLLIPVLLFAGEPQCFRVDTSYQDTLRFDGAEAPRVTIIDTIWLDCDSMAYYKAIMEGFFDSIYVGDNEDIFITDSVLDCCQHRRNNVDTTIGRIF